MRKEFRIGLTSCHVKGYFRVRPLVPAKMDFVDNKCYFTDFRCASYVV